MVRSVEKLVLGVCAWVNVSILCRVLHVSTLRMFIQNGFTNSTFKCLLFCWRASSIAWVLPQEPPDQTGSLD